jgi:hypothetical protein
VNIVQYKKGKEQLTKGAWVKAGDITSYDSTTKRISRKYMIEKLFRFYINTIRTDTGFILPKEFVEKTSERFRLRKTAEKEEKFSL